jgi:hypothetical protein
MCNYIDISSIIPYFCRNPLIIMIVLISIFVDLPQQCRIIFCFTVGCTTIHTCDRWKLELYCIVSWLLKVMAYHQSSTSSKASSTSISSLISSRCVVLWHLIILCEIILWLCGIVLQLRNVILLWHSVIWGWYLVKLWCNFPCHHLFLHPISV